MITTCQNCGGLLCEPGESFAGQPCRCALPRPDHHPLEFWPIDPTHPEARCHQCGGPNVNWFAENDLWNRVCREKPDDADPMLCPRCFIVRAEAKGIGGVWKVELDLAVKESAPELSSS